MNKKKLILSLSLTLALGLTAVASAKTSDNTSSAPNCNPKMDVMKSLCGRGHNDFDAVLAKFGITTEDMKAAKKENKSLATFLQEKGIKLEDFKAAMLEAKTKLVDDAIASGKITKEEGDKIKEKIKSNIEKFDGTKTPKQDCKGKKPDGKMKHNGNKHNNSNNTNPKTSN